MISINNKLESTNTQILNYFSLIYGSLNIIVNIICVTFILDACNMSFLNDFLILRKWSLM